MKEIRGTPQQPNPNKPGLHIPIRVTFDEPSNQEPIPSVPAHQEKVPRRMKLTKEILDIHGYTENCDGCKNARAGLKEPKNHTEACRTRLEEAMDGDEEGRERKRKIRNRENQNMADNIEQEEQEPKEEQPGDAEDGGAADDMDENEQEKLKRPREAYDQTEERKRRPREADDQAEERKKPKGHMDMESEIPKRPREDDEQAEERKRPKGHMDIEMETEVPETHLIKELRRVAAVDLMEMYSPPRTTVEAKKFGLAAGEAMDLTTGWNFNKAEDRKKAMDYIDKHKPKLVIGSPECIMFSLLQSMTPWTKEEEMRYAEAKEHMNFMMQVYKKQDDAGRWFLHEHPAGARSWKLHEVIKVMKRYGVKVVQADLCMFGLTSWGSTKNTKMKVKKSTKFMTNAEALAEELDKKCDGSHVHQHLVGGRAKAAAKYPEELCRAICRGFNKTGAYGATRGKKAGTGQ